MRDAGWALALQVSAEPDPAGLPGQDKLQGLVDGLYSWSLILILAALVVAAIAWAWGAQSNHHGATPGRVVLAPESLRRELEGPRQPGGPRARAMPSREGSARSRVVMRAAVTREITRVWSPLA